MNRSAYTLIELLVVTVLIALLLALMWGIVSTVEVSQTRGAQMTARSSAVRDFAQQFVADVASSIQDARSVSGRSQPSGDDDVRRFGLFGASDSLRLDVFRACPLIIERGDVEEDRLEAMGADVVKTPKLPELKTVIYERATDGNGGLLRTEWDYHLSLRTGQASLAMPFREVAACRFRYFNGSAWRETWDSIASESLPTAVEATLTWHIRGVGVVHTQRIVAYLPASPLQGHTEWRRRTPPRPPAPPPAISLTDVAAPPPVVFPAPPPPLAPPPTTPTPKPPTYERRWMRGQMP